MRKLLFALVVLCMAATAFATVSTNAGRNEYTAIAAQTVFNYTFKIYADTDLSVYLTPAGDDPDDSADLTTAYTVTGAGVDAGGSITLDSGASVGDLLTIVSTIPTDRTVDYQFNGDFRPNVVNNDFDRAVSLIKQLENTSVNTLKYQNSFQGGAGTLPDPAAGNVIGYDGSANLTNLVLGVDGNSWDGLTDLGDNSIGKGSDLVAHTSTANTVTETLDAHGVTLGTLSDFESISLSTDGTFIGNSDTAVPTEKASKTYIDTSVAATALLALKGDGTASVLRGIVVEILDGATADTIDVEIKSNYNGDTLAQEENLAKGASGTNLALNAGGTILTVNAVVFSGVLDETMSASMKFNNTTTVYIPVYDNVSDNLQISYRGLDGLAKDIPLILDAGGGSKSFFTDVIYVTEE